MFAGYGTASVPEIIWTLTSIAGLIMTRWTYTNAARSREALAVVGLNGVAKRGADGIIFGEITRGFIWTIMASVGIAAMMTPSGTRDGSPAPTAWFALIGFLCIQVALVVWTYNDIRMVREMLRMVAKQRARIEELLRSSAYDESDPDEFNRAVKEVIREGYPQD